MASWLKILWSDDILKVSGSALPIPFLEIWYLEAFCRANSHERNWEETVIPHKTRLLSDNSLDRQIELKSILADGVVISHTITAFEDEVDFQVTAHNPTEFESEAHWAQPCIRVGAFTGCAQSSDPYDYIRKCFVFINNKLTFMPTPQWATSARYTPGQVWRAPNVPKSDTNPRPLNPILPSNGLIGCFSGDSKTILAIAWEPYQELFQGIIQCIHSDFRIGGLHPGEQKTIRGKLYIMKNNIEHLLDRYTKDFPEHIQGNTQ